ncbi:LysR family transcriptional regulator [Kitasatospora sp. GAS204B]|uniref:LysR family transcriptional regulator n=1 Tax=unclassified Kitasatospora TaxID=2633591 RepID=UPI00247728DA|nr:LysR family transcriptional regulator [Kitasatospora sp. GAS204B]MDH6117518.1 DNA-binding transcriptional LysR family regulator [Kitasatospora sp. GAS204B]
MKLELRHLRAVCAIADAGSLGRAAAVLGCSQSALSRQLLRIEQHFGVTLFVRTRSGTEPTANGAEVIAQSRDVLARMEGIGHRSAETESRPPRVLRLAVTNSPVLPGMVARLHSRLPGSTLRLRSVYASSAIVELLEQGELEAGIAVDYPGLELRHSEAVAVRGIATEPSILALSARHRLRHRADIALGELAQDAWFLTPDDGAGWPGVFYAACAEAGFTPPAVHEFLGDPLQLQHMIAEDLGVALVQATTRPIPGVLLKPLTGTPLWCRYVLVWRRGAVDEELAQALFSAASAAYQELCGRSADPRTQAARAR